MPTGLTAMAVLEMLTEMVGAPEFLVAAVPELMIAGQVLPSSFEVFWFVRKLLPAVSTQISYRCSVRGRLELPSRGTEGRGGEKDILSLVELGA